MGSASTYWIHWDKTMTDMHLKPRENVDSLDVRLTNLIDLFEYLECCLKLFKVQLFISVVKHFEICQWAQKWQKSRLTYILLLERARVHDRSIAKHIQKTTRSRGEVAGFTQYWDALCRNTPYDTRQHGR